MPRAYSRRPAGPDRAVDVRCPATCGRAQVPGEHQFCGPSGAALASDGERRGTRHRWAAPLRRSTGLLLDTFSPAECANYLRHSGLWACVTGNT